LPAGYLSGSKAEVKAFPKLKTVETEPRPESADVVSLWDRKKIT
jgi:hypothetical protein